MDNCTFKERIGPRSNQDVVVVDRRRKGLECNGGVWLTLHPFPLNRRRSPRGSTLLVNTVHNKRKQVQLGGQARTAQGIDGGDEPGESYNTGDRLTTRGEKALCL